MVEPADRHAIPIWIPSRNIQAAALRSMITYHALVGVTACTSTPSGGGTGSRCHHDQGEQDGNQCDSFHRSEVCGPVGFDSK